MKPTKIDIKILIDNVLTLSDCAKELSQQYNWDKYTVHKNTIEFWAVENNKSVHGLLDTCGFAEDFDTGASLDNWNVNYCDDLKLIDIVFAEDQNGNTVLLHN